MQYFGLFLNLEYIAHSLLRVGWVLRHVVSKQIIGLFIL